jgi:hypothetical protein
VKDPLLAAVLDMSAIGEERAGPRRSRIEEEFALLMTSCAHVAHAPLPAELAPTAPRVDGGPTAAEIWRPVDGAVTDGGVDTVAPAPKTRFVTEIDHPELGPMAVTVERNDGAVRVIFEVQDAIARVALETQRGALLSSLYAAGVKIASVVVSVRSGGITIAQRSSITRGKRVSGDTAPEAGPTVPSGLNLVG